jgi:HEAT repeat protein
MYWRAFALYRVGTSPDLEQALQVLDAQRQQYPDAVQDPDVAGLTTRVLGALASRGNNAAATRLREHQQGAGTCDKEDMEVRAEALSALVQSDPASAAPVLRRTLARRDECSAPLRRRAVYLLGREGVGGTAEDLVEAARNDPDRSVRSDALSRLAQMPGDGPVRQLEVLLATGTDERTQRAALNALRHSEHPDAAAILRRAVQREDLPEQVRADAIRSLARRSRTQVYVVRPGESGKRSDATLSAEDMTLLRGLYERTTSRVIRSAILETMASASGPEGDAWLASIVRDQNQELRYRSAALGRLRRSDVALEELTRLYDTLSERELRGEVIRILGQRSEPAATDKLIDIAKTGTDPVIRRAAISALTKKDDPRTTKLLLELVEKP